MTRICFVIPQYKPATDAHYFYLYQLMASLAIAHDVFVFSETGFRPNIPGALGYLQKFSFLPLRLAERCLFFAYLNLSGYKKIYCHYAETSTVTAAVVYRLMGGQVYKWLCSQEDIYLKSFSLKHLPEIIIRQLPLLISLRLTHHLVTCTKSMKQYYFDKFHVPKARIIVIPNFVCPERFAEAKPAKLNITKPILLYVHWLSERKGADRLIDYARVIKQRHLNFHLLVIGGGPLLPSLKRAAARKRLNKVITFLGPLPNQTLPAYYRLGSFLLLPSKVEEFGRVQLEAMAAGLPILATQTLATHAVLTRFQQELVVPQTNFLDLLDVAQDLINNKKRYHLYVTEGLKQVDNFKLDKITTIFNRRILNS